METNEVNQRPDATIVTKHTDWDTPTGSDCQENPPQPHIIITVNISRSELLNLLPTNNHGELIPENIDVTFRHHDEELSLNISGVLSVADRLTGGFITEGECNPEDIWNVITHGKEYAYHTDNPPYKLTFVCDNADTVTLQQHMLLMFDSTDNLLRDKSLVPPDLII